VITTYALNLVSEPTDDNVHLALVDVVSDWLLERFHPDDRPAGTQVRTREGDDDPVFRLSLDVPSPGGNHIETVSISVIRRGNRSELDIRRVLMPTTDKVAPSSRGGLRADFLVPIVDGAVGIVPFLDAGQRVTSTATVVHDNLGGQRVAALIAAPGRRLPVVVEITDPDRSGRMVFSGGAGPLTGLAHVFVLDGTEALAGFAELHGPSLHAPGQIVVHWAGSNETRTLSLREVPPTSVPREVGALVAAVVNTAALSLAAPRVPPRPSLDDEDAPTPDETGGSTDTDAVRAAYEAAERRVEELEGALAAADSMIANQRRSLEENKLLVDDLVLQKVQYELSGVVGESSTAGVATMADAMRLARERCHFLVFHDRAIETALELEGPEPQTVLRDLVRLDNVARAWSSNEISRTSFTVACRNAGLDFASKISETARQKYEEHYLVEWNGRTVRAEAHVKRGKKANLYRIHVHLDDDTRRVLVAYIGRHLPGKRDH
jgi:hypothetical protein